MGEKSIGDNIVVGRWQLLFHILALGWGCGFVEVPSHKSVNKERDE